MLKAQGTEGGQTCSIVKLQLIFWGFREGFGGDPAQRRSSPITAITELSLRGQPSIKTGPKIHTDGSDSCKEQVIWLKKAFQGAQGMVPNTCSPSPCCCRRVFPKAELSRSLSNSFPRSGCSVSHVYPGSGGAWQAPEHGFWGAGGRETGLAAAAAMPSMPKASGTPAGQPFLFALTPPSHLLLSNRQIRLNKNTAHPKKKPSLTAHVSERK